MLVVDLQGFTSRSERLDVEDVEAFIAPYRTELQRAVERTGGVVSDFAGDGMMALFGAPVAHEDDPERAVRAALAIRGAFRDPESPARRADLHVRLGITTGEVLVTVAGERVRATGDVVNTAARLESAAPADGILIDESTSRATSRVIVLEPAEAVIAKGKVDPVAAWEVVEARSLVPEQARADSLGLVGRVTEAELLRAALERSRGQPATELVSIIGEPGIGKSRLVDELAAHARELPDLVTWRVGRSLPYGEGVAFWALGEMVKSQSGILESDEVGVAEQKLAAATGAVLAGGHDRDWVNRHLRPLVGLDGASADTGDRVESFAAWRRFFEAVAEGGPTVLVFEDIHWGDDALLDFIDLLTDRAGTVPLLIVCTARPELLDRRPGWGGGKANSHALSLTPLPPEDIARLVVELVDQPGLPTEVQQQLLDRAEGNPLYALEYVRMLRDRGLLARRSNGFGLADGVAPLPESIQGIIAARLDTLSPDEKAFLQDAAVIGKTAWLGACCALGERTRGDADELLHGLHRKQFVQRVRRSSIDGETEFAFGHALTRDVAYSQIPRADRAKRHEAAAAWIHDLAGERSDKAELLASHYSSALEIRRAVGEATDDLERQARLALRDAAARSAALGSLQSAVGLYEAALALWPVGDPDRAGLLLGYSEALSQAGRGDEQAYVGTIRALLEASRPAAAATVEVLLSRMWSDRGESSRSHAAIERAAALLDGKPPSEETARGLAGVAAALAIAGATDRARRVAEEALRASRRIGDDRGCARALSAVGLTRTLGDPAAIRAFEEAAEIARGAGYPELSPILNNLIVSYEAAGRLGDATGLVDEAGAAALRFGQEDFIFANRVLRVGHALFGGSWTEADAAVCRLLAEAGPELSPRWITDVLAIRAALRFALGRFAEAIEDSERWLAFARQLDEPFVLAEALALQCRIRVAMGQSQEAVETFERYLSLDNAFASREHIVYVSAALVELGAHDRFPEIPPPDIRTPWYDAATLIAEGGIAEAANRLQALGCAAHEADIRLLAGAQLAAPDPAGARRQFDRARKIFTEAGASDRVRSTESLIGQLAS